MGFFLQSPSATGGQLVEFGITIVVGNSPFALKQALRFQAIQRRIEGTLLYQQCSACDLLDTQQDAVAVLWSERNSFQNQQIQCPR